MCTPRRLLVGVIFIAPLVAAPCLAQPAAAPTLSRAQRAALQALVRAAEHPAPTLDIAERDWPIHLLRASDGSHYVAFSIHAPAAMPTKPPIALYVRLATRPRPDTTVSPERSAVAEWLAGQSPVPVLPRRGIAIGDMPTYGAAGIASRGPGPSQNLQLLELERERAREKREAQERARKASLEGTSDTAHAPRPLLPFEDFDVRAAVTADASGAPVLRRSLTAGPGDYELTVAWVDPEAADLGSAARMVRRRLTLLPASSTEFALSSVIVADTVAVRETPVPAIEQSAHPYSIGPTEIVPARDHVMTTDERLAVVVQVINARGAAGKPDVVIGFRVLRRNGASEEVVGTLAPQIYNDTTLPAEFDVAKGHPIFAAVAVPLRTFRRGEYRLEVSATDRVAGTGTIADTSFTVVAAAPALLREAPALAAAFQREDILDRRVIDEITLRLRPRAPSAAMLSALALARDRRFVDLVRDDAVAPEEAGARSALRVLALYALGDTPSALTAPLRLAEQQSVSPAAVQIIAGGFRATEGNDREALVVWETALAAGADAPVLAPLMMSAWLRLGDAAQAVAVGRRALSASPADPRVERHVGLALLAANQYPEALKMLDRVLQHDANDLDAQWLALQTLFSAFVSGTPPGADTAGRARLVTLAARYIAANGRHAGLARDWALTVDSGAQLPPPGGLDGLEF